ncbi:MAG: hypothetical protein D3914_03310 [Candidatus Electrothrix sp. LOE2]|nr:hypothetical protein [Candidatus Electrothrix sp. LOE2]
MLRLKVLSFLLLIFFVSNASAIYASAQLPAFCNQTLSEIRQTCLAIDVKIQDKNTRGSFNIDASGLKLEAKGNSLSLFHRDKFISDMKYFDYGGCIRDLTDKIVNSALCGGDYGGAGSPPVTEDWLRYSSKGCMRQGAESVKCHFVVENLNPRTEDAVFLSE